METSKPDTPENAALRCSACGASNQCVVAAGGDIRDCWCAQPTLPRAPLPKTNLPGSCLCPQCLQKMAEA